MAGSKSLLDALAGPATAWTPTLTVQVPGATPPTWGTTDCRLYALGSVLALALLDITLTNPGTGGGYVQATLPAGVSAVKNGMVFGYERNNSAKGITGEVVGNTVRFRLYDASFPGSTGARFQVAAIFETA